VEGVHYQYVSQEEFLRRRDADEFAEYASVHGNWYGTLKSEIDRGIADGNTVVFDIDYQGAQQLQEAYPDSVSVMILPPDLVVLEGRLRGRGTDSDEVIARRMSKARHEIHQAERFDYVILNEDLEQAFQGLLSAIDAAPFLSRRAWPWVRDRY
jgi:guanylate kinase